MSVDHLLGKMTLEEKVGQVFLLAFDGERLDEAQVLFEHYFVGGSYLSTTTCLHHRRQPISPRGFRGLRPTRAWVFPCCWAPIRRAPGASCTRPAALVQGTWRWAQPAHRKIRRRCTG